MRYTLAGFRRFAVCLAVCRGRLTVTSALRPSAGVGDLCRARSPKRPFCSLVCQILLGPIMGLLEIPMRRKCCSPNGSSGRTERSILLHIPFSRSSGQCAYRPQLPSRIKVHESQARSLRGLLPVSLPNSDLPVGFVFPVISFYSFSVQSFVHRANVYETPAV